MDETELELREFISSKNIFGAEELLIQKGISDQYRDLILKTSDYFGTAEVLEQAKTPDLNERSLNAIIRLEKLYHVLCEYGVEKYISFDLGMLSKYNYYTGVIFKVYTYGVGDAIAKGGRYDSLLGYFGKNAPAIGFLVVINYILLALKRQQNMPDQQEIRMISNNEENYESRLAEVKGLRQKGVKAALIPENRKEQE